MDSLGYFSRGNFSGRKRKKKKREGTHYRTEKGYFKKRERVAPGAKRESIKKPPKSARKVHGSRKISMPKKKRSKKVHKKKSQKKKTRPPVRKGLGKRSPKRTLTALASLRKKHRDSLDDLIEEIEGQK